MNKNPYEIKSQACIILKIKEEIIFSLIFCKNILFIIRILVFQSLLLRIKISKLYFKRKFYIFFKVFKMYTIYFARLNLTKAKKEKKGLGWTRSYAKTKEKSSKVTELPTSPSNSRSNTK